MQNSHVEAPEPDQLEISIFGPGYGEAISLHIGEGKWILVDSCIDPASKLPASLKYLSDLEVDVENAVEVIIATHWHNDHIRGIGMTFERCGSADFVISGALNNREFRKLVKLYGKPAIQSPPLDEFSRIFELLNERRQGARLGTAKQALADRRMYHSQINLPSGTVEVNVYALSPSDATIQQARLAFGRLLPGENERFKWIAPPTPNHASVVLWIEVGAHKILLGADLQRTSDPNTGWSAIIDNSTIISGKAGVFKIPHHGSKNAHNERVWSELLFGEPLAVVTPYTRGKKPLPSRKDIERITNLTPNAFITAPPRRQQPRWRNRVVKSFVDQAARSIKSVHTGWGHVRFRKRINDIDEPWQIELYGNAYPLNT